MNEKGRNPVLPPEICIADGEAHVFGNRLYVYGSRDLDDTTYCSEQHNVGSTEDMEHWTVHEKSFDGNDVPWIHDKKGKDYIRFMVPFPISARSVTPAKSFRFSVTAE